MSADDRAELLARLVTAGQLVDIAARLHAALEADHLEAIGAARAAGIAAEVVLFARLKADPLPLAADAVKLRREEQSFAHRSSLGTRFGRAGTAARYVTGYTLLPDS